MSAPVALVLPRVRAPTIMPSQKQLLKRFFKEIVAELLSKKDLKHCYQWLLQQADYFASLNIGQLQRCYNAYTAEKILRHNAGTKFHLTTTQMCDDSNTCVEFGILSILTNVKNFFEEVNPFCGLPDGFRDFLRRCEMCRVLNITGRDFNHLLSMNDVHYIRGFVHYIKKIYLPILANEWYDFARQEEDPKSGMAHRPDLEVGNLEFEILLRRRNEAEDQNSAMRTNFNDSDVIQELILHVRPSELYTNQLRNFPHLVPQLYVAQALSGDISGLLTIIYRVFDLHIYQFYRKNLIFEGRRLFPHIDCSEDDGNDVTDELARVGDVDVNARLNPIDHLLSTWENTHPNEHEDITSRLEASRDAKEITVIQNKLGEEALFCMLGANLRTALGIFRDVNSNHRKFMDYVIPILCSENLQTAFLLGLPTSSVAMKQKNTDAFLVVSFDFFTIMSEFNSSIMGPLMQQQNYISHLGEDYFAFVHSFVLGKGLKCDVNELILSYLKRNESYLAEDVDCKSTIIDMIDTLLDKFIQVYVGASMNDLQYKLLDSRADNALSNGLNFRLGTLLEKKNTET